MGSVYHLIAAYVSLLIAVPYSSGTTDLNYCFAVIAFSYGAVVSLWCSQKFNTTNNYLSLFSLRSRSIVLGILFTVVGLNFKNYLYSYPQVGHINSACYIMCLMGFLFSATCLSFLWFIQNLNRRLFSALWTATVLCYFATNYCLLSAASPVDIDVFYFFNNGTRAIISGTNPYSISYPQIYPMESIPHFYFDDPTLYREIPYQPYPPIPLLLGLIGIPFGDVRFSQIVFLIATAIFGKYLLLAKFKPIFSISGSAELASVFVLLQPLNPFLISKGYNDVFVSCFLILSVLFYISNHRTLAAISFGLLFGLKQYMAVLFIPFILFCRLSGKQYIIFGITLAFPLLVFYCVDPDGFINGLINFHIRQPYRPDCISFVSFIGNNFGIAPENPWLYLGINFLSIGILILVYKKNRGALKHNIVTSSRGFVISCVFVYFNFLLFSKQSFGNYYSVLETMLSLCLLFEFRYAKKPATNQDIGNTATHTADDMFATDIKRAVGVHDKLSSRKPKILWATVAVIRVHRADVNMFRKMVDAGCYRAFSGIESGSQTVLDNIGKKISPAETAITTPLASTILISDLVKVGEIETKNWRKNNLYQSANDVYDHPTLACQTIVRYYNMFNRKFYFTYDYIWKKLINTIRRGMVLSDVCYMIRIKR